MFNNDLDVFGISEPLEKPKNKDFLLDGLNPSQKEAVLFVNGPLLILAGAGTGKTKTVTLRMAYLIINGYAQPHQILGLTFTNKAAKEMSERVGALVDSGNMWLSTFHSFCAKLLRIHHDKANLNKNFVIIDQDESDRLLTAAIKILNIEVDSEKKKAIRKAISEMKEAGVSYLDRILQPSHIKISENLPDIYEEYQISLKRSHLLDFDDLIFLTVKMIEHDPSLLQELREQFKFVFVDEYQDTSFSQNKLIRLLCGKGGNLCCVGDEDQSIYSWRGAKVENILNFKTEFGGNNDVKIIRLEENYRSSENIVKVAAAVISNNKNRYDKTLKATISTQDKVQIIIAPDDRKECLQIINIIKELNSRGTSLNSCAILVRASFQNRLFEEFFNSAQIPYRIIDGVKFYDRKEIKDVIAYLRLIHLPSDDSSFERIVNVPKRGIGAKKIEDIKFFAKKQNLTAFEALERITQNGEFSSKVTSCVNEFIAQIKGWREAVNKMEVGMSELTEQIVNQTNYLEMLKEEKEEEKSSKDSSVDRIENIKELISSLSDFIDLQEFLEHVALLNAKDTGTQGDAVSIMTMHASKGLEFEAVFSPGWEENVFPSRKALESFYQEEATEEERRLAYVTITRTKKFLTLSCANSRLTFGRIQSNTPSRFLLEIKKHSPCECFEIKHLESGSGGEFNQTQQYKGREAKLQTTAKTFKEGDNVFHTMFGNGTVQKVMSHYAEVVFEKDGKRMLIHGKFLTILP